MQIMSFSEFERLAQREVHIHLLRADDAVARRITKTSRTVRRVYRRVTSAGGYGLIGSRIDPICDLAGEATGIQSVVAIEARSEIGGNQLRCGHIVIGSSSRILNGDGSA